MKTNGDPVVNITNQIERNTSSFQPKLVSKPTTTIIPQSLLKKSPQDEVLSRTLKILATYSDNGHIKRRLFVETTRVPLLLNSESSYSQFEGGTISSEVEKCSIVSPKHGVVPSGELEPFRPTSLSCYFSALVRSSYCKTGC